MRTLWASLQSCKELCRCITSFGKKDRNGHRGKRPFRHSHSVTLIDLEIKWTTSIGGKANTKKVFRKEHESSMARFPCQNNRQTDNPSTAAVSTDRHPRFWSCEGGWGECGCGRGRGRGRRCCCSYGIYYLWASQGTEASLSVQKHKCHTGQLQHFPFQGATSPLCSTKGWSSRQNAKVAQMHVVCH